MIYRYVPRGVCAREITFDVTDGIVSGVTFIGGCNGNLKAISKLVEGKPAAEIAQILQGNTCGMKSTSCADQLARALTKAITEASEL